jgi:thiosulfate dehydrogenase [quinone] large subunit
MVSMLLPRRLVARLSPRWAARLDQPGYLLLPLRLFLGVTFCVAGLQKLASPAYFDRTNPASVYAQMHALEGSSPIGPLVSLSLHAPTAVGLAIALGELAIGIGTLLGLLSRVAAIGGAVLALSFFLTVSWNTTPYYYGSDIVFLFAWSVLIAFGSGDVLSLDAWLRNRARRRVGLPAEPRAVAIDAGRLRQLCGRGAKCGLDAASGECGRLLGCPVFAPAPPLPPARADELDRRTLLTTGAAVAGVGAAAAAVAAVTAGVGRLANNSTSPSFAAAPPQRAGHSTHRRSRRRTPSSGPTSTPASSGTAIASASAVPVGHGKPFRDPRNRQPAWLVHLSPAHFAAFSAICTHAGCTVGFDAAANEFICPCHGGTYDAATGRVTGGPPPAPLSPIPVHVSNGEVFTA